jgi:hypothetical protein
MVDFSTVLNPMSYIRFARKRLWERDLRRQPDSRDGACYPAGHFHSPLLHTAQLGPDDSNLPFDGAECWEHINLRPDEQRSYYQDLLDRFPVLPFPTLRADGFRYFTDNCFFPFSDAFALSGIIRKEKPRRIIEVGSGFSSAVMLDTLGHAHAAAALTFIEPNPDRLYSLLSPDDRSVARIFRQPVQEVPLSMFEQLESNDVLFIDSSHVAKIGSDVAFILLRILPRLKPGVLVHFHDIFYPYSYPASWIRQGRAWNESLFLRAFLVGNAHFELVIFNSFAGHSFPQLFEERVPAFLNNPGGSIWIRKVS